MLSACVAQSFEHSPLQRNVQHWNPFQTELLYMVLILLLILILELGLHIAVILVSVWSELQLKRA